MISYLNRSAEEVRYDIVGLSTDTKPIEDVPNGSVFFAMDTQTMFMFDAENQIWYNLSKEE